MTVVFLINLFLVLSTAVGEVTTLKIAGGQAYIEIPGKEWVSEN